MPWITKKSPDGKSTQKIWQPDQTASLSPAGAIQKVSQPQPGASVPKPSAPSNLPESALKRGEGSYQTTTGFEKKPEGTVFNPYEALRKRSEEGGKEPVSPYVPAGGKKEEPEQAPPGMTMTPTGPSGTYGEQAEDELTPGFEEWEQEHGKLFDIAEENKDEKIDSYLELYENRLGRLDELQKMMESITAQKNALVASASNVQRAEIQAAYDANSAELRIAQERLSNAQRKVIAEREKQLERKKINEENMLAVIGGFGSMAGNKYMLDSIEEGNDKMAWLKTEFSLQDTDLSNKVVDLNNTFKTDNMKVEQWKSEQIMKNYENLQSYIANIIEDKDMADEEKTNAINAAKDQYNSTISNIHKQVIDARFELSRDIIKRTDQLRKEAEAKAESEREVKRQEITDVRADLALLAQNYAMEDYDKLPQEVTSKIAELETKSGLPSGFVKQAVKNLKAETKQENVQLLNQTNGEGDWTIVAVDKKTGKVVNQAVILKAGKPMAGGQPSGGGRTATAFASIGDKTNPNFTQCGHFSNNMTTGKKVGDMWEDKISKTDKKDNPDEGDTLVIPIGLPNGHTAVVLNYDQASGEIGVVERNRNKDGKTTYGSYNLNDLKAQYGDNFGFISGELTDKAKSLAQSQSGTDQYADEFGGNGTPAPAGPVTEEPVAENDYESEFSEYSK